ncbi:hypothetical protein [Pedobacter sp. Hv1]|uniref:hypothetical protein n=1 Tax=Pedobacter sp. Hv1 TaxID=1740090 RepID=UPI0006D89920|nr:hypothetical protein [Pedobacter sp. Hv1]KQC01505.1 hypothetical protein AQF98_07300 [Pedobacter sp. Hv1]
MKKSIVLAVLVACFAWSNAKAQKVKNVKLSDIHSEYIEVTAVKRGFSDKILISLQYGQKIESFNEDSIIRDDKNQELEYNSALDCVNKMKDYGYELFQVYVESYESGNQKYYVLKRK